MKRYNYQKILEKVKKTVKEVNDSPNNKFKSSVWLYHIEPVVKYSLILGRKLKADLEVLELAALLHDYAGMKDSKMYKDHHTKGALLAEEILDKLNFPKEKIELVKDAIISHRGSLKLKQKTKEAKILASADAMSHFCFIPDMFFLTYGIHRHKTDEGACWLKRKLDRSWNKIMPEGRKIIKKDRELFLKILDQILKI